jgi:hypothetical protein
MKPRFTFYLNPAIVPVKLWQQELQLYKDVEFSQVWTPNFDAVLVPFFATERFGIKIEYGITQIIDTWLVKDYYENHPRFWMSSPVWTHKPSILEAINGMASSIIRALDLFNEQNIQKINTVLIDTGVVWSWFDNTLSQKEIIHNFLRILLQETVE